MFLRRRLPCSRPTFLRLTSCVAVVMLFIMLRQSRQGGESSLQPLAIQPEVCPPESHIQEDSVLTELTTSRDAIDCVQVLRNRRRREERYVFKDEDHNSTNTTKATVPSHGRLSLFWMTATDPSFSLQIAFVERLGGFKLAVRSRGEQLHPMVNLTMSALKAYMNQSVEVVDWKERNGKLDENEVGALSMAAAAMERRAYTNMPNFRCLCHTLYANPGFYRHVTIYPNHYSVKWIQSKVSSSSKLIVSAPRCNDIANWEGHVSRLLLWMCPYPYLASDLSFDANRILHGQLRAFQYAASSWTEITSKISELHDRRLPLVFGTMDISNFQV